MAEKSQLGAAFDLDAGHVSIAVPDRPVLRLHTVNGMRVSSLLQIDDEAIVILDPERPWGSVENLVKIDASGEVVWTAPMNQATPPPNEYVSIAFDEGDGLVARTWGGMRVVLNPETGQPISSTYVK